MKTKFLLFLPIFISTILMGHAQSVSPISRDANISLFSGYFAKKQNTNNNGYWYGAYSDIPIHKSASQAWNISLYGLYAKSNWIDNLAPYTSNTDAFSLGINTGYYDEYFSYIHTIYLGFSLGYKYLQEIGETNKPNYMSESIKQDHGIMGSVNFNLLKYSGYHEYLFPRLQLIFTAEKYFNSLKVLNENNSGNVKINHWNKNYYEIILKQSIVDIPLSYMQTMFLQPKLGFQYGQSTDNTVYAAILECSLHREYKDDFLSVSIIQKWNSSGDIFYIAMINLNLLKLIK
jgi:hypothetical protein